MTTPGWMEGKSRYLEGIERKGHVTSRFSSATVFKITDLMNELKGPSLIKESILISREKMEKKVS